MPLPGDAGDGGLDGLERFGLGDRRVGTDRDRHVGLDEFAQGVETLTRGADRRGHALAPVVVVLRLVDGVHAECVHPRDLLGGRQPAVLDAVTGIGVGMRLLRGLDRVEDHVDRGRRLRMRRSLQADGVCLRDQRRIVGGLVIELPGPARVAHVPSGK